MDVVCRPAATLNKLFCVSGPSMAKIVKGGKGSKGKGGKGGKRPKDGERASYGRNRRSDARFDEETLCLPGF